MSSFLNFKHIKGDFFGGITAGIVALPLALAFGVQSGMGAIAGLYGAMVLGIFAALFGGTETQVSGPTGPMTVVSAMIIASAIEVSGSLQAGMGIVIASFFLAGGFQIIYGLLKIGKYIKYIPYPVLSGFMTGIGVIIILFQIYPFLGHVSENSSVDIFLNISNPISTINIYSVGLGLLTIIIIYIYPKINKSIPSALVALLAVSGLSYFLDFNVPLIGDIPQGMPTIYIGEIFNVDPSLYWTILEFAIMLSALGAIDSLLTSVIADNITKTKHNSNKELIGQGIGNIAASIIGGLPGAGATMRTVVNVNSGGKTRLSGLIHGLFLVAVLFGLSKYVAFIPLSVLSGILITVGIGIIDYKGLRHLKRVPRADALVLLLVLTITVFGNLLHAVGVGVVLACVLFMKKASDIVENESSLEALTGFGGEEPWKDESAIYKKYSNKIFIKHLYGPMFFGFTAKFQALIKQLKGDAKVLIIRMDKVPHIDQSGMYALEESITDLQKDKVVVVFTCIQPQPYDMLKKIGVIPLLVPERFVFSKFKDCEVWLKENLNSEEDRIKLISDDVLKVKKAKVAYRL